MKQALLGLDIGSTNSKGILIDENGNELALVKAPTGSFSSVKECLTALGEITKGYDIKGLAVSGVGSGGIFLDENDNKLRLAPKKNIDPAAFVTDEEFANITGYPKSGAGAGHNLCALMAENPEEAKKVRTFMSHGDYINFLLTGVKRRDLSTSSSLSFQDKRTGENWHEYIKHTGIDPDILPPLVKSSEFIGEVNTAEYNLPLGIPVFAGGHDYLCAVFAVGGTAKDECVNILGTFDMITVATEKFKQDIYTKDFFIFQDNHVYPGKFATTIEIHGVKYIFEHYPELGKNLTERFVNMDKDPNSEPLLKKALSEINEISVKALEYLRKLYPNINKIKAVGGGSNSKEWMKSKEAAFGMPVLVPQVSEASAMGAALIAGVGAGVFNSFEYATNLYKKGE